jgi:hypothetical protein
MYQMHFHRVLLAMHGVFAWCMEVELLERPGLLIQSNGVTGVSLFASLNGMAIIRQRYRTINVVCLQRGEMGVSGRINI